MPERNPIHEVFPSRRQLLQASAWLGAVLSLPAAGCSSQRCPAAPKERSDPSRDCHCECSCDNAEGFTWGLSVHDRERLVSGRGPLPIVTREPGRRNILRNRARELSSRDTPQNLSLLERRMRMTLVATNRGVGLAAPQVDLGVRAIVVMLGARSKHPRVEFFINPRIVERSDEITLDYEGCLSVPGIVGLVKRSKQVLVEYGLPGGETHSILATGFDARIFQHEIDHLDGVLYVDRVEGKTHPSEELKKLRRELRRRHPRLACTPMLLGRHRDEVLL